MLLHSREEIKPKAEDLQPYKPDLMQYLPLYYENSAIMKAIHDAYSEEFGYIYFFLEDFVRQFLTPATATWGLDRWDQLLGVNTKEYPIEERRNILKSKLLMQSPFTVTRLYDMLRNTADNVYITEDYANYSFEVTLLMKDRLKVALSKIMAQIEEAKPAHLDYRIILGFLHELQAMVAFNRWFSEILKLCGTVDVSGEEVVTTLGRRYRENASDDKWAWLSVPFIKASPTTFPVASGLRYEVNLTEHIVSFFSIVLLKVSETTYCGMEVVA